MAIAWWVNIVTLSVERLAFGNYMECLMEFYESLSMY
jgi:hypothetical protein